VAIFHLSAKVLTRSKGQSAVAKAAYNSRSALQNDNTGERHDYRYKGAVLFFGIFAPKAAPAWAHDRQELWSAVEKTETRKNSQLAREIEIALPHELDGKQRENLVKDFLRENCIRKGMIADVALHAPAPDGDNRNFHAHILLTMREIGPEGFGEKMRHLNSKAQLEQWRENWERLANRHLERHGHTVRIDRRTLKAQGIEREPIKHIGPTATQLEREGKKSERGNINRGIAKRNREKAFRAVGKRKAGATTIRGRQRSGRATFSSVLAAAKSSPTWRTASRKLTKRPRRVLPRPKSHPPPIQAEPIRLTAEMWADYRAFKAAGLLHEWRRKWAAYLPS
jgi:hypothetical protein